MSASLLPTGKLIEALVLDLDIDIELMGREINLVNNENEDSGNDLSNILKRFCLLFHKMKKCIFSDLWVVPLDTKELTPLLRGFFS